MQRTLIAGLAAASLAACSADARSDDDVVPAAEVPAASVATISASELAARLDAGEAIQLIDVRTPEEFAEGHLKGAINIPVDQFDPAALPDADGAKRILYCRSDRRSGIAAERLSKATGGEAVHMDGGILAWIDAGLPTAE